MEKVEELPDKWSSGKAHDDGDHNVFLGETTCRAAIESADDSGKSYECLCVALSVVFSIMIMRCFVAKQVCVALVSVNASKCVTFSWQISMLVTYALEGILLMQPVSPVSP